MMGANRIPGVGRLTPARTARFTFDGRTLTALEGDTVASALLASGAQASTLVFTADLTGAAENPPNASPGTGFAQVCVSDTGCGIPPDELPRVFEKFYRGTSTSGEARGAGLGLAIAKHFVELHQGRIWVESAPLQGSRFYFTIPLAHRQDPQAAVETPMSVEPT